VTDWLTILILAVLRRSQNVMHTARHYMQIRCGVPDAFFHSRESGIRKCHSRDSRAPENGVYCSIISAVALWKAVIHKWSHKAAKLTSSTVESGQAYGFSL